uniref:HMG box domain-containing protein n=1 Tax=Ciona savignyi TaxID=51511 RepID=H2Z6Z4_CIOSA
MPQLNSDEAANDEPKTYNDERVGEEERGWHENDELDNIKGDLVEEEDRDPHRRQSYDHPAKVSSRGHRDSAHRNNESLDRDLPNDISSSRTTFPYLQQDIGAALAQQSLLSNVGLPSSSQVPYNPYAYHHLLYGTPSPSDIDTKPGIPHGARDVPAMYALPGQLGQIPHPLTPWGPTSPTFMCTASAMAGMLRYPYPFGPQFSSASAMTGITPFPMVQPHPHVSGMHPTMIPHPAMALPGHLPNGHATSKSNPDKKNYGHEGGPKKREKGDKPSRPYVKKPLNAFMLYMKEQRAKVVAECTLKESAAINQILGRKWHSLNRDEQQKYYEMARKERQLHQQMFPGWSARDNYGKRKKRKKEKTQDCTAQNPKKCRAVFGLEQQQLWCAPCRRKKKCIRYQHDDDEDDSDDDSDSLQYQTSPGDNIGPNYDDPSVTSQLSSSSAVSANNSGQSHTTGGYSPNRGPIPCDRIKQEKSPPLTHDVSGQ